MAVHRIAVKPKLLRWAREEAGLTAKNLVRRFPKYLEWERGETQPTLKQLEDFAEATYAPLGYLLLSEPPKETLPIPDFRTIGSGPVGQPSLNLRDTVYLCELRQDWYREHALAEGLDPVRLVGSARVTDGIESHAAQTRTALGIDLEDRARMPSWSDALRQLIRNADSVGVLVMVSGVVGNNTQRRLDPQEFRGFALVDDIAPLVFINGADTKAAQMFTLAHELAHLCLGESALSNSKAEQISRHHNSVEAWCNRFAAELLVPTTSIRDIFRGEEPVEDEIQRLARLFKVSTLVILRRLFDIDALTRDEFQVAYGLELSRLQKHAKGSGGNFYATQTSRAGERFSRALVSSTLEGQTLYRDAFRLLGFKKASTFQKLATKLGYA